jgi:hypothetical protein
VRVEQEGIVGPPISNPATRAAVGVADGATIADLHAQIAELRKQLASEQAKTKEMAQRNQRHKF